MAIRKALLNPRAAALAGVVMAWAGAWAGVGSAQPAATPWGAQGPAPWGAPPPASNVTTVAPVLVVKTLPGPALWKVTKGPSEVIILGGLTPLPHMLQWDTLRLEHALSGADALYLQPRPKLSAWEMVGLAFNKGALQLPRNQTLEGVLPPADRKRLLTLLAAIHKKPADYDRWRPAVAGLLLISDFRRAAGLSEGKPGTTVMHLAEDAHVPVRYVGDFDLGPFIKTAATLSPQANLACFDAAMDDIEREAAHAPAAARAWADADLKTVGETYKVSVLDQCLLHVPSVQGLMERGTRQGVETIETALVTPGKSVAVVDLNFLMRPDGILQRLKADGATITVPE
jgi:uncharacterized protein YbaP (TraB family)